jgi:RNA polymerase sigma factor (sigma-70 family)
MALMDNAATPDHRLRDIFISGFDAGCAIPYTGRNRERPLTDVALACATAISVANHGDATDYYLMKESGVQHSQDDPYGPRRAQLEALFHELPPPGSADYWRRIEEPVAEQRLPLEVLARCLRERIATGVGEDAGRIFNVIVARIKRNVGWWAGSIASQARSGTGSQESEDLEQECYKAIWEELVGKPRTFLLESFSHGLERIRQHVAHSEMRRSGEWKRKGVEKPTRIPREALESLQAEQDNESDPSHGSQAIDTTAQDAFDLADYSDLLGQVDRLSREDRAVINGLFYDGRTQAEIAAELGVTDRTIRNRLKAILKELRRRYEGGEEENHV